MLCLRINKTVHISLQNLRTMWPDLLRSNSISKVWMPKLQTRVITGGKKCQIFICLIAIQCFKVFVFLSFKALNNWNFLELICFQQGQHEYTLNKFLTTLGNPIIRAYIECHDVTVSPLKPSNSHHHYVLHVVISITAMTWFSNWSLKKSF